MTVGGDPDLDACGLIASVQGLRPSPGNVLNVRSGPGLDFTIIEQISEGTEFIQCTMSDDLEWLGIVLPDDRSDGCGLGDPIAEPTAYRGDCVSGWVHRSFTTQRQ